MTSRLYLEFFWRGLSGQNRNFAHRVVGEINAMKNGRSSALCGVAEKISDRVDCAAGGRTTIHTEHSLVQLSGATEWNPKDKLDRNHFFRMFLANLFGMGISVGTGMASIFWGFRFLQAHLWLAICLITGGFSLLIWHFRDCSSYWKAEQPESPPVPEPVVVVPLFQGTKSEDPSENEPGWLAPDRRVSFLMLGLSLFWVVLPQFAYQNQFFWPVAKQLFAAATAGWIVTLVKQYRSAKDWKITATLSFLWFITAILLWGLLFFVPKNFRI